MYTVYYRSWRQITLLGKVRSTRHNAMKHDGQLFTWFYGVTSWPCDELTGSHACTGVFDLLKKDHAEEASDVIVKTRTRSKLQACNHQTTMPQTMGTLFYMPCRYEYWTLDAMPRLFVMTTCQYTQNAVFWQPWGLWSHEWWCYSTAKQVARHSGNSATDYLDDRCGLQTLSLTLTLLSSKLPSV